ncbi:hypothetical protein M422DRAFT_254401 [Sphaerobolus stellatus SS14]|uniref:Unplaced genomic scaffold SPHSTscaffold_55, whole genome shotgun sequence n=1 Tax=Sphaerobolus stellatus (strain SS14) TaxID=990650 RepID=A0A0C9VUU7_SPHS4|nr:hypothetical protein M422DRAFT_254401 [Sphaerobolus stellatus SS14]
MKELRSCQISNVSNIAKLHDFSPFLEQLLYTPSEESYDRAWNQPLKKIDPEIKKEMEIKAMERIQTLAAFKHLTHLGQFLALQVFAINTPGSGDDRMLNHLVDSIQILRYVEIHHQGSPTWICVLRSSVGRYTGFRRIYVPFDGLLNTNLLTPNGISIRKIDKILEKLTAPL